MALHTITPAEKVLAQFSSEDASRIGSSAIASFSRLENEQHDLFHFELHPYAKSKLTNRGFYLSPFSYETHSHAVCKTLESHLINVQLPSYIDDSFIIVGIKDNKLSMLKKKKSLRLVEAVNRCVTSHDIQRYGPDFHFLKAEKNWIQRHNLSDSKLSSCVSSLLPKVLADKTEDSNLKIFLYDELHYWSIDDIIDFLEITKAQTIVGSFVFPTEILIGCQESMNPWAYEFEIRGNKLIFAPDGVWSEAYEQPLASGNLLKINQIRTRVGNYSVQVRGSTFCHCIIIINRDELINETYRTFSDFDAISIEKINVFGGHASDVIPISCSTVLSIFKYIRTLKKPDLQSGMAKHRQLTENPSGFEIRFIEDFVQFLLDHHEKKNLLETKMFSFISEFFLNALPIFLQRFFRKLQNMTLGRFLEEIKPLRFTFECRSYSRGFSFSQLQLIQSDEEEDPHLTNLINNAYPSELPSRFSKAVYYPQIFDQKHSILVQLNPTLTRFAASLIIDMWVGSFDDSYTACLNALLIVLKQRRSAYCQKLKSKARSIVDLINMSGSSALRLCVQNLVKGRLKRKNEVAGLIEGCRDQEVEERLFDISMCRENFRDVLFEMTDCFKVLEPKEVLNHTFLGINGVDKLQSDKRQLTLHQLKNEGWTAPFEIKALTVKEVKLELQIKIEGESAPDAERKEKPQEKLREGPASNALQLIKVEEQPTQLVVGKVKERSRIEQFVEGLDFTLAHSHKGRKVLFFSKGGFSYGFNSTIYNSSGWNNTLDSISDGRFNSCLIQKYEAGAQIGFHSDDEECYDKGSEVLTLNLYGKAEIHLKSKGVKGQLEHNVEVIQLEDGDEFLMPKGFQETHKHKVHVLTDGRVSLTFRYQARTLTGVSIPKEGRESIDSCDFLEQMNGCFISAVPDNYQCELSIFPVQGDGNCFWYAVSSIYGLAAMELKRLVEERAISECILDLERVNEFKAQMMPGAYASDAAVTSFCNLFNLRLIIKCSGSDLQDWIMIEPVHCDREKISMGYLTLDTKTSHYNLAVPKKGCVIRAVSEFLKQNPVKILSILSASCSKELLNELNSGFGIQDMYLEEIFNLFNIKANVSDGDGVKILNREGKREANFIIEKDHFSYSPVHKMASLLEASKGNLQTSIMPIRKYEDFLRAEANVIEFSPDFTRARRLANSFLNGTTGVICSKTLNGQADWLADKSSINLDSRKIGVVVGTFGSGKSHSVVNLVKKNLGYRNTVISPRASLKNQLLVDLGVDSARKRGLKSNTNVVTFEVALAKKGLLSKSRIFIDEMQLYPPGYLDLICMVASSDSSILVMGDPAQSCYDSDSDRHIFMNLPGNLDELLNNKKYIYLSESRRFANPMYIDRLPCSFNPECMVLEKEDYALFPSFKVLKDDYLGKRVKHFLVSSLAEKSIVRAHVGRNCEVFTFGESTGMNFPTTCVLLTQDSMLVDERRWVVALSRARENIFFVNMSGLTASEFCSQMGQSVIYRFLTGKANVSDLKELLPGEPIFSKKFLRLGSDEVDREGRLSGDPWLKCKIFLGQRCEAAEEAEVEQPRVEAIKMKIHCPTATLGGHLATVQKEMKAKEFREKRIDGLITEQFPEEYKGKGEQITAQPDCFEAIYPRHKAGDTATFVMAARKRLSFSKPAKEKSKYLSAIPYGELMLKVFLKHVKLQNNFDSYLFEEALADFEKKKLEKPAATIENHSGRSDPDWPIEQAMIFMKSQLCTKFDNRFRDAKAGQTLACFQHNVLCRLAPYIRYIEKKVNKGIPSNLYIHSGKNFDNLRDWVADNRFNGLCTESDYEAFDSSQDCNILAFEVALMKYLHLPRDLIEDYMYLKFNTRSKLGEFSVMRFTGEAGTFLFNTLANMVFTFMRYEINGRESICFAGDDMCANSNLRKTSRFEHVLDRMKLKAKVQKTYCPTFCGWRLGDFGIIKRPELVLEKIMLQKEKGKLQDCLDNYAIEVSYAYNLGERLVSILSEKELEAHYLCVRFFVQNKKFFKSSVLEVFKSASSCTSPDRNFYGQGS